MKQLQVTPIDGEPDRFFVASSSRPGVQHVVDVAYSESPKDKPKPMCSCEAMMARGNKTCPHVEEVQRHVRQQNRPDYNEADFEVMP